MNSGEKTQVVLHATYHLNEITRALQQTQDIELISFSCEPDRTVAALETGAPVLVTSAWDDRFLTPSLVWLQSVSVGVDYLPLEELDRRGVVVTSARGVHARQMAEHAFALLLALTRRLGEAVRSSDSGEWIPRVGVELSDLTLGILGLGTVGEEIARRAKNWDLHVIGTKMTPTGYSGVADSVYGPSDTLRVCAEADAVVVALPLTKVTRHCVGDEELAALSDGWLVNVGRGAVVDESALLGALTDGKLRGAGLDVFEKEPLPADSPFWRLRNVIVSSHSAGLSPRYGERLAQVVGRNLVALRGDGDWLNRLGRMQY